MKLTNYEHACFTLEKDGTLLVVDPGDDTTERVAPENVVAIVVTHEHPDHFDPAALGALVAHNPEAVIYGHEHITRQFGDTLPHQAVEAGQTIEAGPFKLEFFGGDHAIIHPDYPAIANLGVIIDDSVGYPGDSFVAPLRPLDTLLLPVAAPWLKLSEAMDYVTQVAPRLAVPTHDAILSPVGKALVDRMLSAQADAAGFTYQRPEAPIEVGL